MSIEAIAFQTAGGSIYGYNPNGLTFRLKLSDGRGQGEIDPPAQCVFVSPSTARIIEKNYLRFAHYLEIGWTSAAAHAVIPYRTQGRRMLPPHGSVPYIAIKRRGSGAFTFIDRVSVKPVHNRHPVELAADEKAPGAFRLQHMGSPVSTLYRDMATLESAIRPLWQRYQELTTAPSIEPR